MDISDYTRQNILWQCSARGWSINHLAKVSKMTQSTIENIVTGVCKSPGIRTIQKICNGLGMTMAEFYTTDLYIE